MVENSKIEWTDHTFNPWVGCTKVSAGCANCYAETLMDTRLGFAEWGDNGTRVRTSNAKWREPIKWNKKAKAAGIRQRVFCASLADVFEDREELIPWRRDLFELILDTPHLDWLLLTKRPGFARDYFGLMETWSDMMKPAPDDWPLPNVWIGTSIENQETADKRIPELSKIPASVRFLSCEPLLGSVDLGEALPLVDWVIVGGESGPNARPMHPDWVRSIRDQCQAAGVAFFFKQWGEWIPWGQIGNRQLKCDYGHTVEDMHYGGADVFKVGKKAAGRLLDGRTWDEFPEGNNG